MSVGTFDDVKHEYRLDGRLVPNVTKVLADLLPGFRASDWHLQRGRAVHACAALVAKRKAFEHDPRIAGQVEAVRRFLREVKPEILAVEMPVYSERYQYAGTLDLDCEIDGIPLLGDYKAGLTPATIYQCAAYAQALLETTGRRIKKGVGIEIHDDGTYKLSEVWDLKRAGQEWLHLLGAHNIRARLGYTNKGEEDV